MRLTRLFLDQSDVASRRTSLRRAFESLENRWALAGDIQGQVFRDADADGVVDGGEAGQIGWVVYIDGNNNGLRDAGELMASTAANGQYTLPSVPTGRHLVRLAAKIGQTSTSPLLAVRTVDVASAAVVNQDFGVLPATDPPMPAFGLTDVNPASNPGHPVSPRDYLGQISAWYFTHTT